jgi:hypothetical protein
MFGEATRSRPAVIHPAQGVFESVVLSGFKSFVLEEGEYSKCTGVFS